MHVAILGGGTAGFAAAITLKEKGFEVSVYERRSGPSHLGAGIVLWPNASFILERMGLLESIAGRAGRPVSMARLDRKGESLGSLDVTRLNALMGYPSLAILREDLQAVLLDRLTDLDIPVHFNHRATHAEVVSGDRVRVYFESGASIEPDILLGADGRMNSITRTFVHGNNRPVFAGFVNWVGVFESEEPLFEDLNIKDVWGVGKRFGIVPIRKNKAYWAGGMAIPEAAAENIEPERLRELFKGWPEPISQILADSAPLNTIAVHDHDPIERWHKGRVLLIGDAAHASLPTSGQGACQALEDAWWLGRILAPGTLDLQTAFATFTDRRRGKCVSMAKGARALAASLFHSNPEYCGARDARSRATDYEVLVRGMAAGWSAGLPIGQM